MRCFIEIDIPDNIKSYILEKVTQLKNASTGYDFRIVKKENLHLTLAFLGEIDEKKLEETIKTVSEIIKTVGGFECNLSKIEAVPAKCPRMIWITLDENNALSELCEELKGALMLENEHGGFKAHITAARLKPYSRAKKAAIISKTETEPLKFLVGEIRIMKSVLKSDGPEYTMMKSIQLNNKREHA